MSTTKAKSRKRAPKTASKGSKRPTSADVMREAAYRADLATVMRRGLVDPPEVGSCGGFEDYTGALPFGIHEDYATPLGGIDPSLDFDFDKIHWTRRDCFIAERVLRHFYRLSFEVPLPYVGHAAAAIAQAIPMQVSCLYDARGGRLVFVNPAEKEEADYELEERVGR